MDSAAIERTAARWLVRSHEASFSAADRAALTAWLDAATAHRVAWLRLEAAWRESGRLQVLAPPVTAADMRPRRRARAARGASGPRWRRVALAVGAVGLVLVIGATFALQRHRDVVNVAEFATHVGTIETVALQDGSEATLGSNSRVEVAMSRRARNIRLVDGEAFFAVAKDAARPFVVLAAGFTVTAVGTRFAVRHEADGVRVVVTEGVVQLRPADGRAGPVTRLPAGSVATANAQGTSTRSPGLAAVTDLVAWRRGYLSFHDTPLANAVAELNRYNRQQLRIADDSIARLPIGGRVEWSNVAGFVRLLQQGFPIRAEHHGDTTVLYARRE